MANYVLTNWTPEDPAFWKEKGSRIAKRNLWISIFALVLAFCIWMLWSVVVVNLDAAGFNFNANQLFWLTAMPALSGATLRIFYSFLVPVFGGRKWTAISTALLLIPALGMGFALRDPGTSYPTLLILALLCGLGGGNFSSSMANISFFYPTKEKGTATGLNAGIGNLGVSLVQFVTPLVISVALFGAFNGEGQQYVKDGATHHIWLENAGFIWVPFIVLAALAAWFGMNDVADAKASFADQAIIFKRKHNWLMCWLYIGAFGSFIGFSAAMPLLIKSQFPNVNPSQFAFIGPFVGAALRPVGGWLSDKMGSGAKLTLWLFVLMIICVLGVLYFLPGQGRAGSFYGFLTVFILLFAFSGLACGSTFRMIPVIFLTQQQRAAAGKGEEAQKQALHEGNKESAAVLGFAGAMGAYGGFFIPKGFGSAIHATGLPDIALYCFIAFYVSCVVLTWWFYARKNAPMPS